jgi:hypothetical protein
MSLSCRIDIIKAHKIDNLPRNAVGKDSKKYKGEAFFGGHRAKSLLTIGRPIE